MNQCKLWVGTIVSADSTGGRCIVNVCGTLLDCVVRNNADVTYGSRALVARLPGSPRLWLIASRKTSQTFIIKRIKKPVSPAGEVITPETPIELFAFGLTESSTFLEWSWLGDGIAYYEIERSTDGLNFTKVGETTPEITLYIDAGLVDITHYWYRVRAISPTAASAYSNIAKALTFGVYTLGKQLSFAEKENYYSLFLTLGKAIGFTTFTPNLDADLSLGKGLGITTVGIMSSDAFTLGRANGVSIDAALEGVTYVSIDLGRIAGITIGNGGIVEALVLGRQHGAWLLSSFTTEQMILGKTLGVSSKENFFSDNILLGKENDIIFGQQWAELTLGKQLGLGGDLVNFPTSGMLDNFNRADCWPPGPGWYFDADYGLVTRDNQATQQLEWPLFMGPAMGVWNTAYGPKMEDSITVVDWGGDGFAYIGFTDHVDDLWGNLGQPGVVYMAIDYFGGQANLWIEGTNVSTISGLTLSVGDEIAMIISNGVVLGLHKPVGGRWQWIVEGTAPEGFDSAYPLLAATSTGSYMKLDNLYGGNSLVEL